MKFSQLQILSQAFLGLVLFLLPSLMFAQGISVSGHIKDAETNDALIGVNILVKGTVLGTITDAEGKFSIKSSSSESLILVISMIGFETQEMTISNAQSDIEVHLKVQTAMGKEIIVSASRVSENIMESPVTIEKMDILSVRENPSGNYFDGLANLKGVDMMSSSMLMKSVNARGFNAPYNTRFVQRIDGMEAQSPGFSIPLGNIMGVSDIDLESVEVIPGTSSALYGPNAFNGITNITSRNPFLYQGVSSQLRTGVNHVDGIDTSPKMFFDASVRYAKAFNDKFAVKFNISYLQAEDWHASSGQDVGPHNPALNGANNPGRDALNYYGDDDNPSVGIVGGVAVNRTGYFEGDLANYQTKNFKSDIGLHYKINEKIEASYMFKYANATTVLHGGNRYMLDGVNFNQHRAEVKGANFYVRAYAIMQNMGNSYDTRNLGYWLNQHYSSDTDWKKEYQDAFDGKISGFEGGNHVDARRYADRNRLQPGSADFERVKKDLISQNTTDAKGNLQPGARMQEDPNIYHAEGQYDFSEKTSKFADVLVGGNYRYYNTRSYGGVYNDGPSGNPVNYYEYGSFVQLARKFMSDKLKMTGAIRYDKSEHFDGRFTPRISAIYSPNGSHHIRASYQTGFKMPIMQEQFININLRAFQLIGGVSGVIPNNQVHNNSFEISTVGPFVQGFLASMDATKGDFVKSVQDNAQLLKKAEVEFVKPEQVKSYEIGYKSLIGKNLFFDFSYYFSAYKDFIGLQAVMNTSTLVSNPMAGADILTGNSRVFLVYTNAREQVYSQGFSGAVTYNLPKGYNVSANYSWAKLFKGDKNDPIIPAFNTPEHKVNIMFGNRNVYKKIGFNLAWRWQDQFTYQFAFVPGFDATIPAFQTLDAQVSAVLKKNLAVKVGGTNVFNNRYLQAFGAPTIGAMYYVTLTFDPLIR